MIRTSLIALSVVVALSACSKKPAEAEAPVTTPQAGQADATQPAPAPAATEAMPEAPAGDTAEARERAEKQAALDYATMEDGYINDPKGQWAVSATASSSAASDAEPDSHSSLTPWQATSAPNGDSWSNGSQDVGFDWVQLKYASAVTPAEVRAVLGSGEAAEAITKIELIDTDGKSHVVWSGLSDAKRDERGPRTWFVRKVDAADFSVDTVKLTFANNVASGYKYVDAVQLVSR
jgi:hypothetical protein